MLHPGPRRGGGGGTPCPDLSKHTKRAYNATEKEREQGVPPALQNTWKDMSLRKGLFCGQLLVMPPSSFHLAHALFVLCQAARKGKSLPELIRPHSHP